VFLSDSMNSYMTQNHGFLFRSVHRIPACALSEGVSEMDIIADLCSDTG